MAATDVNGPMAGGRWGRLFIDLGDQPARERGHSPLPSLPTELEGDVTPMDRTTPRGCVLPFAGGEGGAQAIEAAVRWGVRNSGTRFKVFKPAQACPATRYEKSPTRHRSTGTRRRAQGVRTSPVGQGRGRLRRSSAATPQGTRRRASACDHTRKTRSDDGLTQPRGRRLAHADPAVRRKGRERWRGLRGQIHGRHGLPRLQSWVRRRHTKPRARDDTATRPGRLGRLRLAEIYDRGPRPRPEVLLEYTFSRRGSTPPTPRTGGNVYRRQLPSTGRQGPGSAWTPGTNEPGVKHEVHRGVPSAPNGNSAAFRLQISLLNAKTN